ncbi:MAG: potassium transporter Kup [Chloroflexota bacterium]
MSEPRDARKRNLLALAALGIVYGDIGTSPLYALRECFSPTIGLAPTPPTILGILSLLIWALILVVTVKYLWVVMRADNNGEGGILALMALAHRGQGAAAFPHRLNPIIILGLLGAAFVYGDGIITPAISVLSAIEGLNVTTPSLTPYVVLIAVGVLVLLFSVQSHGTGRIGQVFGPIMLVWFGSLALLGLRSVIQSPTILESISPLYGIRLLIDHPGQGFVLLGSVFLALTGAEALYADMGHFGKGPIRLGWSVVVLPSLLLQYLGQGALLLRQPDAMANPFYLLAPTMLIYPLVGLATLATVIASQALLSGAFSLTQQAIHLGYLPRMHIRHTSSAHIGQIYVPVINWALFVGTLSLVLLFGSSSNLAAAYGIAVSGTMVMTTLLIYVVARHSWHWPLLLAGTVTGTFLMVDLSFFSANILKIWQGGWLPVVLGLALFTLMTTWSGGRRLVTQYLSTAMPPLAAFLKELLARHPIRVPGRAIFLTSSHESTPPAFLQNVRHNSVLHELVVFLRIVTARVPIIPRGEQLNIGQFAPGIYHVTVRHGFMETPEITTLLDLCQEQGVPVPLQETTFFMSRINSLATPKPGMALWREHLFVFLSRNSRRTSAFLNIPSEQVIEIGVVVDI